MEGRFRNFYIRSGLRAKGVSFPDALILTAMYCMKDQYNLIHPTHKEDYELEILKLNRKLKTLKTETSKQRVLDEIKAISEANTTRAGVNPEPFKTGCIISEDRPSPEQSSYEVHSKQRAEPE